MRTFLIIILATILGVGVGAGITALRIGVAPWDGDPGGVRPEAAVARPGKRVPKVVVDHQEYEFGSMDIDSEGSHDFVFKNVGYKTLQLSAGKTSCRCAVAEIQRGSIPPGESGKVTLKWTADKKEGPYRQTAAIKTSDPARPQVTLTVSGRITVRVRAVPPELVLTRISASQTTTEHVRLLCYVPEPLEIVRCELADRETADYFEVTFEPLPSDQLQGEAGEDEDNPDEKEKTEEEESLEKREKVRSGYLLRVTIKPGLPLGAFRQKILIRTNLASTPKVEIPIAGAVVGDISIVGRGWDEQTGVLSLGTISSREGIRRRLLLVARGPHCKEVEFKSVETDPDLLRVDEEKLKETTAFNEGRVTQTPLVIQIPKGSRPTNRLGSKQGPLGRILINTNHPQNSQLRILVRFAVQG